MTPSHRKNIVAYNISNHRLASGIGQWSTIPISRDSTLGHFPHIVEIDAYFVLECPPYNSSMDEFQSFFFSEESY